MVVRINKAPLENFKGDLAKTAMEYLNILYVLAGIVVLSYGIQEFAYGIKALMIFAISLLVARETEIFFYTQKNGIARTEAKEAIKTTRPEVTALIYALLLPVGTPLFVVAIGSFVSIFIGKMVFGGYSFNVFNPAIVGRLFVGIAWPALMTVSFAETFDNYLLELIFQTDFSAEILTSPLVQLQASGIVTLHGIGSIPELLFKPAYGMMFSAVPSILYIALILFYIAKKTVDLRPLFFSVFAGTIILSIIAMGFELNSSYVIFHLLIGGLLFVALFMMTDPFTKPYSNVGILFYTGIFTLVFVLIRFLGKDADGVLYALLFANLFVPLLNKKTIDHSLGINLKSIAAVVAMSFILIGAGLFINKILDQRIQNNEIIVSSYDKN